MLCKLCILSIRLVLEERAAEPAPPPPALFAAATASLAKCTKRLFEFE